MPAIAATVRAAHPRVSPQYCLDACVALVGTSDTAFAVNAGATVRLFAMTRGGRTIVALAQASDGSPVRAALDALAASVRFR